MATWSSRRKFSIALTIFIIIAAICVGLYFLVFYKAPTCFDGLKNGDEYGVDCGGGCVRLCQSTFLPAKIVWGGGKFEKISEGYYNTAALVANPNTNAAAVNVPYKFTLYDSRGILITERTGRMTIPAHRNVLVFDTALNVGKRIPTKATFEFMAAPVWFKSHDTLGDLVVLDKKYSEREGNSSLEVGFQNKGHFSIKNIAVGVVLYDIDGNAIGFSRTKIDELKPGARDIAPFTWPFDRDGKVVEVEALPLVAQVRD